jgi:hypothetical protein
MPVERALGRDEGQSQGSSSVMEHDSCASFAGCFHAAPVRLQSVAEIL